MTKQVWTKDVLIDRNLISRAMDIVVALVLLAVLSPVLLVVAIIIAVDDPGPPWFSQLRVGKDLRRFRLLKFRTMRVRDADTIDQGREAVLAGASDARITRFGRLLRRASIDELPQLFNIALGTMTFVGPRPIIPEQLDAIPPQLMARFEVKPGLTGLAQVEGRRSLDWMEQLRLDALYVARRSFWIDLIILLRTIGVVVTGRGVYDPNARNWRAYRGAARGDAVKDQRP